MSNPHPLPARPLQGDFAGDHTQPTRDQGDAPKTAAGTSSAPKKGDLGLGSKPAGYGGKGK